MPPRKRHAQPANPADPSISTTAKGKQPRRSKLAADNDLTADDEREIKVAWTLFRRTDVPEYADEKEGVIRTEDLRRALKAQNLHPASPNDLRSLISAVDPTSHGYILYPAFLELCALRLHDSASAQSPDSKNAEVEAAFGLFTKGGSGPINIHHLRRVARELKEDVGDDVLRAMILEANGGSGVSKGVGVGDFRGVMIRAGVLQE